MFLTKISPKQIQATHGVVWLFCALLSLATSRCQADDVILDDGKQYNSTLVHTFNRFPDGALFIVRTLEPNSTTPLDHPIEFERVRLIRFQDPDFSGEDAPRVYRKANIRLVDGQILENISLSSYMIRDNVPVLIAKPGDAFPHTGAGSLPFEQVQEILFSVRDTLPRMTTTAASQTLVAAATSTLEPDPLDQTLGSQLLGGGNYVGEEVVLDFSSPSKFDDSNSYEVTIGDDDDSFGSFSSSRRSSGGFIIPVIGLSVGIISFLVYLFVTSLFGGIYLFISSRVEGVNDFPLWKSFIAAGALAVFPMISFLLCARFIPYFGFAIGLLTIYGVARAIVMGAMEIMEEKAEGVLWTFLLVQILVFFLSTNFL